MVENSLIEKNGALEEYGTKLYIVVMHVVRDEVGDMWIEVT